MQGLPSFFSFKFVFGCGSREVPNVVRDLESLVNEARAFVKTLAEKEGSHSRAHRGPFLAELELEQKFHPEGGQFLKDFLVQVLAIDDQPDFDRFCGTPCSLLQAVWREILLFHRHARVSVPHFFWEVECALSFLFLFLFVFSFLLL